MRNQLDGQAPDADQRLGVEYVSHPGLDGALDGMIPRKAIGGRTSRAKIPKGCPNAEVWATIPSATRALDRVLRNSVARPWASAVVVDLAVWSVNCSVVMNVTANCRCQSAS